MTDHYLAFIGTYTTGASEGIYTYRFDAGTGALERLSVIGGISNPSWVEVTPSGRNLYAVGEETHGVIKAYAIDPATGTLTYLNEQLTGGEVPCHISVDPTEAYALLANYGSGSVAMLPIQADGSLAPLTGFVQHQGSSIHPVRQLGPHAHSIILDAANGRAFAPGVSQAVRDAAPMAARPSM
jgi:6-phosphogluconolactonase